MQNLRKEKTPKATLETHDKMEWVDLVGFENDKSLLRNLVLEERLPTVMLFEGREGMGKSMFLFYIAALHFCENQNACGNCNPCQMLANNKHPDLLVVRGNGETLKVSSISDIGEFLGYSPQSPHQLARRLVLIIDAEDLTTAAVNKLLKTMEEPSPSARILMSSSRMRNLLPTLLSRCVHWHLKPPSSKEVEQVITRKRPDEMNKELVKQLIDRFGNSPGKVLKYLERVQSQSRAQNLTQCRKVGEILSFAESFKQEGENSLSEFLPEFECELNSLYREASTTQDISRLGSIAARRGYLKELKTLINKQKIALNSQMVIEKLGFYNLQLPVK